MSPKPSLAAVCHTPGLGAAEAEHGLAEAKRKLDVGRDRVGLAAAQRVDEMRDEADALARVARKRARRIRTSAYGPHPSAGVSRRLSALVSRPSQWSRLCRAAR